MRLRQANCCDRRAGRVLFSILPGGEARASVNVGVMICRGGLNGMEAGPDGIDSMAGMAAVVHERKVQTRAW